MCIPGSKVTIVLAPETTKTEPGYSSFDHPLKPRRCQSGHVGGLIVGYNLLSGFLRSFLLKSRRERMAATVTEVINERPLTLGGIA
jgi:hypothetical protein